MTAFVYDIATDSDREVTQDDVDRLQRTAHAFGELAKKIKFYIAEVTNGLVLPGQGILEIDAALRQAERIAVSLSMDAMLEDIGHVHGRHVLVVER